jgi:hypothetical protein
MFIKQAEITKLDGVPSCKKSKIGEVLVKPACYTSEGVLLDGLSDQMTRATSLMRKREAPDR